MDKRLHGFFFILGLHLSVQEPNPKFRAHRDNPLFEPLRLLFVSAGALASKPMEKTESAQRYGDQEQREINEAVVFNVFFLLA